MVRLLALSVIILLFQACTNKEDLPASRNNNIFPSTTNDLPSKLTGKWIRTSSLRTFDYKPDEWVAEASDTSYQKFLQLNANKTYQSNQLNCGNCQIELLHDTLYVLHSEGFYKFPVLLLNDSLLHLKTKIDQPTYSLPNTGLFDFVLEEKYRKVK
ncbi:MAG: hypothetical protein ABI675_23685 [Chitinophagaceae bacterium]